ncbi:Uncharacterised protein [uncultured archaeon]|nr:Uncharacterised protein [uncultured archaeon]
MNKMTTGLQKYQDLVTENWTRFSEIHTPESWFVSPDVYYTDSLKKLKKQSINEVLGEEIITPKAVALTGIRDLGLFVPGILVSEGGGVKLELESQVLSLMTYAPKKIELPSDRGIKRHYLFLLSEKSYDKERLSATQEKNLSRFVEKAIDCSILFKSKRFLQDYESISAAIRKNADKYSRELQGAFR